jgi:surface protein
MGKKRAFSKLRRNHNLPKKRTMKKGGMDPDFSIMPPPPPAPASSSNPVSTTPRYKPQTKEELQTSIREYPGNRDEKGDINTWDVTLITDMSKLFTEFNNFNEDISGWDVSNVTNMHGMFFKASSFNQPLNSWNVSNVTNIKGMFFGASSFNQPLDSWNVSNLTSLSLMFHGASSFNQPLNAWNVSNVTDMKFMFAGASSFNQPLNSWDVSNVTMMNHMFFEAQSFNQPLNSWNVSNVTIMNNMFKGASSFNQSLESWNVSNVTIMDYMFQNATSFNQSLSSWNVHNVRYMSKMFLGASNFRGSLIDWDISNVAMMDDFSDNVQFEWPLFRRENVYPAYFLEYKQLIQQVYQNTHNERYRQLLAEYPSPAVVPAAAAVPPSAPLTRNDFTSQNIFNRTATIPLEDSTNRANPNDEGYDFINLENVKVSDYLNQDRANVIFYMNGKIAILSDKTNIRRTIFNGSSVKYRCIKEGTTLVPVMTNVDTENPYVMLNSLGSTSGGLVPLGAMKTILADPSIRIIEIATPEIATAVSTASLQMLGPNPNALAASHCQAGQGDKIYALKKMETETTGGTKRNDKRGTKRTRRTRRTKKRHVRTNRKYQRRRR